MTSRNNDFYPTPGSAVDALLLHYPELETEIICEPCAGDGAIASNFKHVEGFDIDPHHGWEVKDARDSTYLNHRTFVTNPPFSEAYEILQNLLRQPDTERVFMLLRLTFLEPTVRRGGWLEQHAPHHLIVCPRMSFTNDGKTDSVTCAWMVWYKARHHAPARQISVVSRSTLAQIRAEKK